MNWKGTFSCAYFRMKESDKGLEVMLLSDLLK